MKIKVKDLLQYVGGNTKVVINDCFNTDNNLHEIWRGKVGEIDWDNIPCGNNFIEHITIIEKEDWLQICV